MSISDFPQIKRNKTEGEKKKNSFIISAKLGYFQISLIYMTLRGRVLN